LFAQWVIYLYWKKKFAGSGGVKGGSHEYILQFGFLVEVETMSLNMNVQKFPTPSVTDGNMEKKKYSISRPNIQENCRVKFWQTRPSHPLPKGLFLGIPCLDLPPPRLPASSTVSSVHSKADEPRACSAPSPPLNSIFSLIYSYIIFFFPGRGHPSTSQHELSEFLYHCAKSNISFMSNASQFLHQR
jgi:hypothetical protein